ncbi:hotdog fold thioesterase, partial [Staphylococcus aureus]
YGYLHGGASIALGETARSLGSANLIDTTKFIPLGLEMNDNHIHFAKDGHDTATAEIIHHGKSTHGWDIQIKNDIEQLLTVMRVTVPIK